MQTNIPVITIDGPSGSGKGTIGQLLAKKLGWHFLDSGALYRVLALAALQEQVVLTDENKLVILAEKIDVQFAVDNTARVAPIFLDGIEVTDKIRSEECGNAASKIAALPLVRHALLEMQYRFRQPPGLVADGRDMGTVVFPDAKSKFFLLASAKERALRRHRQLKERGINVSLDELCNELTARDRRDEERLVAPLVPAADAVRIDTTGLSIEQVLQKVAAHLQDY